MSNCEKCYSKRAVVVRSRNRVKVCKECFYNLFENDIHECIVSNNMFGIVNRKKEGKLHNTTSNKSTHNRESVMSSIDSSPNVEPSNPIKVGIGISGGKDSTVLAHILHLLNIRHNYGLELVLLCVDEGINGYRDQSIDMVHSNRDELGLRLKLISYEELFGTSMDKVVSKIGKKGNCTYCGVFRRQALEEAARETGVDYIATGHNADDMAETVLLNILRGDAGRLTRCTSCTGNDTTSVTNVNTQDVLSLPRCKPFKYSYQQEIVLYAYFKKLKYFSTECPYSPNASRGDARSLIKELEKVDAGIIERIIQAGEDFSSTQGTNPKYSMVSRESRITKCDRCNHPTSGTTCIACSLLEKLKIKSN